jgi:hypothetical protein
MKILTAALVGAALIAAPLMSVSPASAQAVTTTTTVHTYHYGYGHRAYGYHRAAAYRPCGQAYGSCNSVYMSGTSATTGQAVDMDYQAPIGEPIYANGDVTINCSCTHHH